MGAAFPVETHSFRITMPGITRLVSRECLRGVTHRLDSVSHPAPDITPADGTETESPTQATLKALTTALGSRSMILSNVFAAPVGTR